VYGGGLWQNDIRVGEGYFFVINTFDGDGFYLGSCNRSTYSPLWGRIILFSNVILFGLLAVILLLTLFFFRRKKIINTHRKAETDPENN